MFERLKCETDERLICALCGRTIAAHEPRVCAGYEKICRDCCGKMELWQVLELLDVDSAFDLFSERGMTER